MIWWDLKWLPGSTRDSRWRNLFSYVLLLCSVLLVLEVIAANLLNRSAIQDTAQAMILVLAAIVYFMVVIVGVLLLVSRQYGIAPVRLARDAAISMLFNILSFATLYRTMGITLEEDCAGLDHASFDPIETLYFSMVTFSTLGYGDFRPCDGTRLWAAFQAILGNLHLAIIVAAAFLIAAAQRPTQLKKRGSKSRSAKRNLSRRMSRQRRQP